MAQRKKKAQPPSAYVAGYSDGAAEAAREVRWIVVRVNGSEADRHVGADIAEALRLARGRNCDGLEYGVVLAAEPDDARHREPPRWYPVPGHWR